jgi:ABC-2 type transport system ATP-binding protein
MIKLKNVSKRYGGVTAVDNISFDIVKGEIVGFLGPNGAGKTTTMRMIAGYLSPDSGSIEIAGTDIENKEADVRKYIGYLPENNPLYPNMLVSDLLAFSADLQSMPKEKRKEAYDFVVSACGISDKWYRPIGELSKGYKQRVGLAVALLGKPDIIMLDEPTEGLDPNQRAEIRTLIKDLAKDHTVLMSTHVMQEATAVCNRLLIIRDGRLIADGSPDELIHASEEEKIFTVCIAGSGVSDELKNINGVKEVRCILKTGERETCEITTGKGIEVAPSISALAFDKKWIIWGLTEEKRNMEDVFHALTQERSTFILGSQKSKV